MEEQLQKFIEYLIDEKYFPSRDYFTPVIKERLINDYLIKNGSKKTDKIEILKAIIKLLTELVNDLEADKIMGKKNG